MTSTDLMDDDGQSSTSVIVWGLGLSGSLLGNLILLTLILLSLQPQEVTEQSKSSSEFEVSAQNIRRSEAQAAPALGTKIAPAEEVGQSVRPGAFPQSKAKAISDTRRPLPLARAEGQLVPGSPVDAEALPSVEQAPAVISSQVREGRPLTSSPASLEPVKVAVSNPQPATLSNLRDTTLPLASIDDEKSIDLPPAHQAATELTSVPSTGAILDDAAPSLSAMPPTAPKGQAIRASLAFPGQDATDIDPQSLAAYRQFLDPGAQGEALRDGLGGLLASLPCARVQLSFDPNTATLDLRGHIPEEAMRGPVLAALRAEMGTDIGLSDNLRLLPAPQCAALTGIADVGLPQSTDQLTNPMLIGADAHARVLAYSGGEQLFFDLTAPDYPAFVYVDYFDADGDVLHLMPNDIVPLAVAPPKSSFRVGAKQAEDPGLKITVAPPYGQEIAVAFAASHPLFPEQDNRPLQEPAAAYLEVLKQAVAQARRQFPDFKGEWVYFLVATSAP